LPDIISLLFILTIVSITLHGIAAAQAFAISRANRMTAWKIVGCAFVVAALVAAWRTLQLPIAIMQAKVRGSLPEHLTWEQWVSILGYYLFLALIIIAFDKIRRDYRNTGL